MRKFNPTAGVPKTSYNEKSSPGYDNVTWFSTVQPEAPAMILYNCHHDGDQYRITKFDDGEPAASYLCTPTECECPAAHRDTCRHRQMLPIFIDQSLTNTHWFLAWDNGKQIVDLSGSLYTAPPKVAPPPSVVTLNLDDLEVLHNTLAKALDEPPFQPHSPTATTAGFDPADEGSIPSAVAKPWRRI